MPNLPTDLVDTLRNVADGMTIEYRRVLVDNSGAHVATTNWYVDESIVDNFITSHAPYVNGHKDIKQWRYVSNVSSRIIEQEGGT